MAKHLTWCLKRTFILTNRFNVCQRSISVGKANVFAVLPKLPQVREMNVDYDEPKDFQEFNQESKCGKTFAISTLMKVLSVTRANARKAVDQYPAFKYLPKKSIYQNFQTLREVGVYKSTIKDNKFLLTDTNDDLKKKIELVKSIDIDINDAVHLFHLSVSVLASFVHRSKMEASYLPNSNRIRYLAEKFKCDVGKICRLMSYYPHMLQLPIPKLLSVTEYFLDAGMDPEHIMNDPHSYNYRIGTIIDKITRARQAGIKPLRPWVLRCPVEIWDKVEERQSQRGVILNPNQTVQEHLSELFECDIESVNYIMSKDPQLLKRNLGKLMSVANLLRNEGYTIEDIQRSPRIMHRNYFTLKDYFNAWRKSGTTKLSLFQLLNTKEKFKNLLAARRMIDSKVKKP